MKKPVSQTRVIGYLDSFGEKKPEHDTWIAVERAIPGLNCSYPLTFEKDNPGSIVTPLLLWSS